MTRILIIDDNEHIRLSLRLALEDEDYEVEEADDGNVGLELFRQKPADLTITDIFMPEKDGIETISDLVVEYPGVKIIAISGEYHLSFDSCLKTAKEIGANDTFLKPVNINELLETIKKLL